MATPAQIEANRANAARSTGPRSLEGKERSARNALKHGLAGHGVVLPEEMPEAIQERKDHWRDHFRPDDPHQEWLFERICIESVRADSCLHQEIALSDELAQRAVETWDDDRRLEAEVLASGLSKRPEVVQRQLLQTRQGCDVLIREWEVLDATLRKEGGWRMPTSWDRALDLLGVPVASREGRNPGELGPGNAYEPGLTMVADQIAGLRRRQVDHLIERDARVRSDAESGLAPPETPALRRLRRYEAEGLRRLKGFKKELLAAQEVPSAAASGSTRSPDKLATPPPVPAAASPAEVPAAAAPAAERPRPQTSSAPMSSPKALATPRPTLSGSAPTLTPALGSGRKLADLLQGPILGLAAGPAAPSRRG